MKRIIRVMMAAVCVLAAGMAQARTMGARQALERSMPELDALAKANASVAGLQLAGSRGHNGVTALYIFSSPEMFVIVSANDNAPGLLAYSLEGGFSAEMPPAMQWWLDQYSERIGSLERPLERRAPGAEGRQPVSPLCTSLWDQTEPFNNSCPLHGGRRPLTGCVATAMAQIMRYHEWPDKGTGTTAWTCNRDYSSHDHYHDFEATTFDWQNMLDSYGAEATTEQKAAVAGLMLACGAASRMQYGAGASGTFPYIAAEGMIEHLKYDRGMEYLECGWFEGIDQWDQMCYDELSQGRPILYGGENDRMHTRHAFVMDGYSEEGLYHINWGWGGKDNGYFRLDDFSYPGGNYRLNHTMVRGIKPAEEASEWVPAICLTRPFTTDEPQYSKEPGVEIWFMENFQNVSLTDFWIMHGVRCVPVDGTPEFYVSSADMQWYRPRTENRFYTIAAQEFPEGTYDVYPVFRTESTGWMPCYQYTANKGAGVRFEVSATTITTVSAALDEATCEPHPETIYYDLYGRKTPRPADGIFIQVTAGRPSQAILLR